MSATLTHPPIAISFDDYETLNNLAEAATDKMATTAHLLLRELHRARVVQAEKLKPDTVRIGSYVIYRLGDGPERSVQLVLPYLADIAVNRISVLTPIGVALIGLTAGQAIHFTSNDGRSQKLHVVEVRQEARP